MEPQNEIYSTTVSAYDRKKLETIQRSLVLHTRNGRRFCWLLPIMVPFVAPIALWLHNLLSGRPHPHHFFVVVGLASLTCSIPLLGSLLAGKRRTKAFQKLQDYLMSLRGNPYQIYPFLLHSLPKGEPFTETAREFLKEIIPAVEPHHLAGLKPLERSMLNGAIYASPHVLRLPIELRHALIEMLGRMGDRSALFILEKAVYYGKKRKEPQTVQLTERAKAQIEARLAGEKEAETLVRGSSAPSQAETLLRPAAEKLEEKAQQVLLRPMEKD